MTIKCVEVVFYTLPAGACPVKDFLDTLPPKIYRKAFWTLDVLQQFGRASAHYFKHLTGTRGLYEVRVNAHRGDLRILGFFTDNGLFVLTNGFLKRAMETPRREIDLAEQRKRDYLERHGYEAR